jgi:hypothetical protein
MTVREIECSSMDWIDLAQDRDQWKALVNTLTNRRVPENAGKFLVGERVLASRERISSMKSVSSTP